MQISEMSCEEVHGKIKQLGEKEKVRHNEKKSSDSLPSHPVSPTEYFYEVLVVLIP